MKHLEISLAPVKLETSAKLSIKMTKYVCSIDFTEITQAFNSKSQLSIVFNKLQYSIGPSSILTF